MPLRAVLQSSVLIADLGKGEQCTQAWIRWESKVKEKPREHCATRGHYDKAGFKAFKKKQWEIGYSLLLSCLVVGTEPKALHAKQAFSS